MIKEYVKTDNFDFGFSFDCNEVSLFFVWVGQDFLGCSFLQISFHVSFLLFPSSFLTLTLSLYEVKVFSLWLKSSESWVNEGWQGIQSSSQPIISLKNTDRYISTFPLHPYPIWIQIFHYIPSRLQTRSSFPSCACKCKVKPCTLYLPIFNGRGYVIVWRQFFK